MNISDNQSTIEQSFQKRLYQYDGWRNVLSVIKSYLEGTLLLDGKIKDIDDTMVSKYSESLIGAMKHKENIHLKTSIPLWMATGSGKSYTMGETMNKLFKLRNRYFPDHPIKTLVLNDRISLVNQLHTDFIDGRDGKPGFISEYDIHTQILHSKADQQVEELYRNNGEDKEVDMNTLVNDDTPAIEDNNSLSQDEMYFSTFQTAYLKNLDQQITDLDVIIIDEAHKLSGKQKYETLMRFYKPNKHGRLPLVFVLSATMKPILHLVNDPVINFGLPEYIASEHSPQVNYNLITTNEWSQDDISFINQRIVDISHMDDLKEKKRAVSDLKEKLEEMLKKSIMNDTDLVTDFINRAKSLDHTIIFAKDIASAEYITQQFNEQTGDPDTAIAIHSRIDETDAEVLSAYKTGKKKIIVAVNKLNEGIDMPQTQNVVFWRDTDSDTIFQQQFGRGLRGDEVNIYDYVGGLRNLSWVQGIHHAVDLIHNPEEDDHQDTEIILWSDEENNISPIIDIKWEEEQQQEQNDLEEEEEKSTDPEIIDDKDKDIKPVVVEDEEKNLLPEPETEQQPSKNIDIRIVDIRGLKDIHTSTIDIEGLFQKILKFDEELKIGLTKEEIEEEFDELGGYEELIKYKGKQIEALEIKGNKITKIASSYGFKSKYGLNVIIPSGFQEFVSYIYGKEFMYEVKDVGELTKEEIEKEFDELGGYEELIKYKRKQIEALEIKGNKITKIASSYGFKSTYDLNIQTMTGFQEFVSYMYGKEFMYEVKDVGELTKEEIEKEFDELGGYEELMKYKGKQIEALEIKGNKIILIAKSYGFKSMYDLKVNKITGFQEFMSYMYGKEFMYEVNELKKEEIEEEFDELGGYEELMKYKGKQIEALEIKGNKIILIAKSYGFKSKYGLNVIIPSGFQEFVSYMYGKEFMYEVKDFGEITKEEIEKEFDELGGYEELIKYKRKQIEALEIKGNKIILIAKSYGFKSKYGLNVIIPSGFQEFVSYMYGKEFMYEVNELTKEEIEKEFDELGGYEELIKYTLKQIEALEIKGKKLTKIASTCSFKSKYDLNILSITGFQEFMSYMYGKEFMYEVNELKKEEIEKEFDELGGYEELIKYKRKQIEALEIKGNKITKIASSYGFKSKYNLKIQTITGFQEFISFVYGDKFIYKNKSFQDILKDF